MPGNCMLEGVALAETPAVHLQEYFRISIEFLIFWSFPC